MSVFCPKCSFEIKSNLEFCPKCNYDLKKAKTVGKNDFINCENCGEENPAGSVNCKSCGIKLSVKVKKTDAEIEKKNVNNTNSVKTAKKTQDKPVEKQVKKLSPQQIVIIFAGLMAVGVIMLIGSGIFSGKSSVPVPDAKQQEVHSGADLSSLQKITELENEVKSSSAEPKKIVELANMLFDAELYEKAVIYYNKYLEKEPEDANARVDLGICYFQKNDSDNAVKQMEKALEHHPKHIMAQFNLGIVNLNIGNFDKAKSWFKKVIENEPNSEYAKKAEEILKSH